MASVPGDPAQDSAAAEDELEDTVLGSRRSAADELEDTVLGSRRSAADELEDTVRGSRRSAADELEDTVLGSRRSAAEDLDDTVLGSRRAAPVFDDLDDTVLGSRHGTPASNAGPLAPVTGPIATTVGDTTAALGVTQPDLAVAVPKPAERVPKPAERAPEPARPVVQTSIDDTVTITPARRSTPDELDPDLAVRQAATPDPAILRAPYRPREMPQDAPLVRLPDVVRPPLPTADGAEALRQQRRRSQRGLVTLLIGTGLVVVVGLVALAWLVVPALLR